MPGAETHNRDELFRLPALQVYLLGQLDFEAAFALQRRIAFEVSGEPSTSAVLLCQHPAGITVGREGSRAHIRLSDEELVARRWDVRWVARGGGVTLHVPGQVACYPILSLAALGISPAAYIEGLCRVVADLCQGLGIAAEIDPDRPAVRVRGRRVATIGTAIRDGVTTYGMVVNGTPDLECFRGIDCDGDPVRMTSLQRECPAPVRLPTVRQRLLDLLACRFRFDRLSVFHHHPTFLPRAPQHAVPARHR